MQESKLCDMLFKNEKNINIYNEYFLGGLLLEFYSQEKEAVLKELGSSETGLTGGQSEKNLAQYGKNELIKGEKASLPKLFFAQFKNLMIIILIAAAVISFLLGEGADAIIIFVVVVLNSVLGAVQEYKAGQAIDALSKMAAPYARVIRDGTVKEIPASCVTVGDVVMLDAGDHVPADIRIIRSASLKIEEAALTGESVPVEKMDTVLSSGVPLAERVNMAYAGTGVTYGSGRGVVCAVGMGTEMGRIARALSQAKADETPLQKKMNQLSKILTYAVLAIAVVIFFVGIAQGNTYFDMFLMAVSIAVAAIPEGLAAVVTIVLTMGVTRLARQGAIIRRLPAVETLGCTQIICSDKTGTLTQNKMKVEELYVEGERLLPGPEAAEKARMLGVAFAACNDAKYTGEGWIGDPTETALLDLAETLGLDGPSIHGTPRVEEMPFDSDRKMMTTLHDINGLIAYTKGAPDCVLSGCTHILANGEELPLTEERRRELLSENAAMAGRALRVLACAYRRYAEKPAEMERDMVFIGLAGMMDPPRPEVREAVRICRGAGMRPVMITGDHKITAEAIARGLGILSDGQKAVSGAELDQMDDEALQRDLLNIAVYARVSPEHKVRIVDAFKKQEYIVAMTGDGVNDAPALKRADIGVGMGITGTEVSKSASDMILTDDNFATIVSAVSEGRRIYANIKKTVQFLLSANLSEVVALFFGTLMGYAILNPAQILWINLVTDTLPALALGMEAAEKDSMRLPPRDPKKSFLAEGTGTFVLLYGAVMGAITLLVYLYGIKTYDKTVAGTMAFLVMGMSQLFYMLCARSIYRPFFSGITKNKFIFGAFFIALAMQLIVVLIPGLAAFFRVTLLTGPEWIVVLLGSVAILPVSELAKWIARRIAKK